MAAQTIFGLRLESKIMKLWKLRFKILFLRIATCQVVTTAVVPPISICFKMSYFVSVGMFLAMFGLGIYVGLLESCSPSKELEKRIENLGEQIQFNAVVSPFVTAAVIAVSLFFTK